MSLHAKYNIDCAKNKPCAHERLIADADIKDGKKLYSAKKHEVRKTSSSKSQCKQTTQEALTRGPPKHPDTHK